MGFISRLFGKKEEISAPVSESSEVQSKPSEKEIFQSPSMLSEWVIEYVVHASTVEDDFDMAPDEDARKDLNITYEQVERLAREEGLLRAVGAGFLVKQYYDDSFYLKFISSLYKPVAEHMYSEPTQEQINNTREAIEVYINSIDDPDDEEMKEFSKQYLYRIYDDNDNFYKLMLGGIGGLAIQSSLNTFEVMRDVYFKVTKGMSYENNKVILETMDK